MSATRKASRRKQPSDLQRSCHLANQIIDTIKGAPEGVTVKHAVVAARLALRQVWAAGGGSEAGLIAFIADALDETPALYYGKRSRRVH